MGTVGVMMEILGTEEEAALRQSLSDRTTAAIQHGAADGTLQRFMEQQAAPDAGER